MSEVEVEFSLVLHQLLSVLTGPGLLDILDRWSQLDQDFPLPLDRTCHG